MIAAEGADKWRMISEGLTEEARSLREYAETKNDWEAIIALEAAARDLWSAYSWIATQHA